MGRKGRLTWWQILEREMRHPMLEPRMAVELHKQSKRNSFINSVERLTALRAVYRRVGCKMLVILALREPLSFYRSLFCYAFSTRRWQNIAPTFSWTNAFCCQGQNLQTAWLWESGWPTGTVLGYTSMSPTVANQTIEAVKSVVDMVITPSSQPYAFAYLTQEVYGHTKCSFTRKNHKPCKREELQNENNRFTSCKKIRKLCKPPKHGKNSDKFNSLLKAPLSHIDLVNRVGVVDSQLWEAFREPSYPMHTSAACEEHI